MLFSNIFSKSVCSLVFVLCGFSVSLSAQSTSKDSLLQIIRRNKNDNSTFRSLKKLAELNEKKNPQQAIRYLHQAVSFPFHLDYAKEFVDAYNSIGSLYNIMGLYDSSLLEHRQALELAQKFNFENEIAQSCQGIALNFMRESQPDSARAYLQQALVISTRLENSSFKAGIFVNLGNLFLDETNYSEALNQFIKAAKNFEGQAHDAAGLGKTFANIGNIECILGHYDKAFDYTQRSLRLSEENGNEISIAYCHKLLGRIFRKQNDYEKALVEYRLAIKIYQQRGDQRNESETYQGIGNIYYDLRQYKNSIAEYEKSLRIAHRISNSSLMAYAFSGMGFAWYELKKFNAAIVYFDSSMMKAREIKNRYLIMDGYQLITNIHEEQGHYQKALKFHRLYSELRDSLIEEENRQGTEEMEAKYQNVKKQNQIELLQKDQMVQNISLQQSRTVQTAMVVAFVFLIIIVLLVFNRYRLIHQTKRQMEIEQMRNEIARDLHDDMGSTLSSINIISQLAIKENQLGISINYFQRIADQSAKMMESMSDMVWSINPDNDSLQKMLAKMKEFSAEILEPKNIAYQFLGEETLNGTALDVAKRKNLFLIFKETINNAAKYSESTFINISIAQVANELLLTIHDNGKGFDSTKAQNGNGLRNMKERAREISATLDLQTIDGQGTTLKLKMALT